MALAGYEALCRTEVYVAKPEWGQKRTCSGCGSRFYDLTRDPITCPNCGVAVDPTAFSKTRRSRAAPAKPVVVKAPKAKGTTDSDGSTGDADNEEGDNDILEDPSDLGEDEDDVSEVVDSVEETNADDR